MNGEKDVVRNKQNAVILGELVRGREQAVRQYLDRLEKTGRSFTAIFKGNPVRIKHLEMITDCLHQIAMIIDVGKYKRGGPKPEYDSLRSLMEQLKAPEQLSSSSAWELAYRLEVELVRLGDDTYLHTLLRAQDKLGKNDPRRWDRHFPTEDLNALHKTYRDGAFRDDNSRLQVRSHLEYLHQQHMDEMRLDRARIQLRGIYLGRMGVVLLILTLALLVLLAVALTKDASTPWLLLPLVMITGAMGSVLSRAIQLGKQPVLIERAEETTRSPMRVRALMSQWADFIAQPVIGASSALVLFLVFYSDLLQIGNMESPGAAVFGIIGFLAGFSEPFFIGILDRVAGHVNDSD